MKNTEFDPIDLHSAYSQENTSIDLSCEKCAESDNSTSQFAEQGQDTEKRTSVLFTFRPSVHCDHAVPFQSHFLLRVSEEVSSVRSAVQAAGSQVEIFRP